MKIHTLKTADIFEKTYEILDFTLDFVFSNW